MLPPELGGGHETTRVHHSGGAAAGWPLAAYAQEPGPVYRTGFLAQGYEKLYDALLNSLKDLGYQEGRNLVVERRYAGRSERPEFAADGAADGGRDYRQDDGELALEGRRLADDLPNAIAYRRKRPRRKPCASRRQHHRRRSADRRAQH